MLDERRLPRQVAFVHAVELRHRHVRLVDHHEVVVGEVVEQRVRRGSRPAAVDMPRIVLDAAAEPDLAHHLQVVGRAHAQPFRLEQLALIVQLGEPLVQLLLDRPQRPLHPVVARHVVRRGEDRGLGELADDLAGQRVELRDALDRVSPPLDPRADLLVRREDLERVARDAERPARAADLVPLVLDVDQPLHRELERDLGSFVGTQDLPLVLLGRAQPVDARDARDDQDVAAGQEGGRGRVPEPLDLVVHRRVLLDVRVGGRDVRLRLVVVVVADEVLDRVVGEHLAELVGQLCAERLVGRDHQGRALDGLDHMRDRERLPGPGGAQQGQGLLPGLHAFGELADGLGLVAGGLEVGRDTERGHGAIVGPGADTHGGRRTGR